MNPNLKKPKYSVIVLMYHRTRELVEMAEECISAVKNSSQDYELIIVDNGSTQRHDWTSKCNTYIRFDENMGISRGWNAGLLASRGKYKVIIGDDVIVRKGWLEAMQEAMDMPDAGVVNPHVEHLPPGIGIIENYKWFSGACFMLTQGTIDKAGYFREDLYFPCNFEDHDYWTRVMRAGLKLYVNYGMSVQHGEGQTLHAPDLSSYFQDMKKVFMAEWGFDNQEVFCGNGSIHKALANL